MSFPPAGLTLAQAADSSRRGDGARHPVRHAGDRQGHCDVEARRRRGGVPGALNPDEFAAGRHRYQRSLRAYPKPLEHGPHQRRLVRRLRSVRCVHDNPPCAVTAMSSIPTLGRRAWRRGSRGLEEAAKTAPHSAGATDAFFRRDAMLPESDGLRLENGERTGIDPAAPRRDASPRPCACLPKASGPIYMVWVGVIQETMTTVHVIGAGMAGLSCAVELGEGGTTRRRMGSSGPGWRTLSLALRRDAGADDR